MPVVYYIVERAPFALLAIVAVLAVGGLPKSRVRYRALLVAIGGLSLATAVLAYFDFVTAAMYLHDQMQAFRLTAVVAFLVLFTAISIEIITLSVFRRLAKRGTPNA